MVMAVVQTVPWLVGLCPGFAPVGLQPPVHSARTEVQPRQPSTVVVVRAWGLPPSVSKAQPPQRVLAERQSSRVAPHHLLHPFLEGSITRVIAE